MIRLASTLFVIAASVFAASAQQVKPLVVSPDQPVPNDDRGQAFILTADLQPLSSFGHLRKTSNFEPQQYSIFVGERWTDPAMQLRETRLQSLLANVSNEADLIALEEIGIKNRFGPTASLEQAAASPEPFTDLGAQRMIAALLSEGLLPRPNSKAIYVIFLDAGRESTLGSLVGGKHFAAYHGVFNSSGARIRYAVVPFTADEATAYQIALRIFVAAALRPAHTSAK